MTSDDLKQIRQVVREEINTTEEGLKKLDKRLTEQVGSVKEEMASLEEKLNNRMDLVEERLGDRISQLSKDIGDSITDRLMPMIDEKADKTDIDRLERKMDNVITRDLEQNHRLDRIESLPSVAHELKLKK